MKYILGLILILFSATAFCQTASKYKPTYCQISLAGVSDNYTGTNLINPQKILADPIIRTVNCTDSLTITSFDVVITYNGSTYQMASYGSHLTPQMLDAVKQLTKGSHFIIQNAHYESVSKKTGILSGINFTVN